EIPVFENEKECNCLQNSHDAQPGTFFVKTAEDGFPDENHNARRAEGAADLRQRKENKEARSKRDANPGLRGRAHEPEENRRGNQEQNKIRERVKNHTLPSRKSFGETSARDNGANASGCWEHRPTSPQAHALRRFFPPFSIGKTSSIFIMFMMCWRGLGGLSRRMVAVPLPAFLRMATSAPSPPQSTNVVCERSRSISLTPSDNAADN